MKIKIVRYRRVFPVGQYANEQIEWEAHFDEEEGTLAKASEGLAHLFERSITANRAFDKARQLDDEHYRLINRLGMRKRDIENFEAQIEGEDANIERINNRIIEYKKDKEDPDNEERIRLLLDNKTQAIELRKQALSEITETREAIRQLQKEVRGKKEEFDELLANIRGGNYDITEEASK